MRECTLPEAARSQRVEKKQSQEAAAGRGWLAGLQESLAAVAEAAQGSPEGAGERVRLGSLEAVVGTLPRLGGSRAGVAGSEGGDVTARVLRDHIVSGSFGLVRRRAYVRSLEEDPPAWECRRLSHPPLLWTRLGEGTPA